MSLAIKATVEGLKQVQKAIDKTITDWQHAVAGATYQEGLAIIGESMLEVPVDTGRLRQTAYVAPPRDIIDPVSEAGYGTDYAVAVHEREDVSHEVGKAQFLRDPFNRAQSGYVRRILERTRKLFKRGARLGAQGGMPQKPREGEALEKAVRKYNRQRGKK